MATLIPALGSRTERMTAGKRRLAERLEGELEDDYLLWYGGSAHQRTGSGR